MALNAYAECHFAECLLCCHNLVNEAKCRYAECRNAECRNAECRGATKSYYYYNYSVTLMFLSFQLHFAHPYLHQGPMV
jgi:hypothetical protein